MNKVTCGVAMSLDNSVAGPKEERDNSDWEGWRGDNPPYHAPVFVLCEKPREPIAMKGGITFYFVQTAPKRAEAIAHNSVIALLPVGKQSNRLHQSFYSSDIAAAGAIN